MWIVYLVSGFVFVERGNFAPKGSKVLARGVSKAEADAKWCDEVLAPW